MKNRTTKLMLATALFSLMAFHSFADRPIKGMISYHDDPMKPVPGVSVKLYDADGLELIAETTTNMTGKYIFANVPYGQYQIIAEDCSIEPGGVEEMDELMIQDIIDGVIIPTPIESLAADIDQDGQVTPDDITMFEELFPDSYVPEWVFTTLPVIDHNGTKTQVPTMGGSSSGDVNGTFVPTGRNERLVESSYFAKQFTRNFSVEVSTTGLTSINGMGLVIEYPANVMINKVASQIKELDHVRIEENRIIVLWNDKNGLNINNSAPIVTIYGSVDKNYNGEDLRFNVTDHSHFVSNGNLITPEFSLPYLTVTGNDNLSHCYPNPASDFTKVYITLPCTSKTTINIFSLTGQLVKTITNEELSSGKHSFTIPVSDLKEGVYVCNLVTDGLIKINQSKRLVVVH